MHRIRSAWEHCDEVRKRKRKREREVFKRRRDDGSLGKEQWRGGGGEVGGERCC